MPEVDPVNQFQTEKEKAQSSQCHPSCQFKIIHVGRLKRVGDAVIHLISRSAICWTTLPFALIRQPPGPIGTAISILSLSVAQPANPFHPGPPLQGVPVEVACRLHPARLLPVPLASQLGSGTSALRATYSHPPIATGLFSNPQPATHTPHPSRLLHFRPTPCPKPSPFLLPAHDSPFHLSILQPPRHHEHDRRGTRSRLEAQWPSSAIVGAP